MIVCHNKIHFCFCFCTFLTCFLNDEVNSFIQYGIARFSREGGIMPPKSHCSSHVNLVWFGLSAQGVTSMTVGYCHALNKLFMILFYIHSIIYYLLPDILIAGRMRWKTDRTSSSYPQIGISGDRHQHGEVTLSDNWSLSCSHLVGYHELFISFLQNLNTK